MKKNFEKSVDIPEAEYKKLKIIIETIKNEKKKRLQKLQIEKTNREQIAAT